MFFPVKADSSSWPLSSQCGAAGEEWQASRALHCAFKLSEVHQGEPRRELSLCCALIAVAGRACVLLRWTASEDLRSVACVCVCSSKAQDG